MDRRQTTGMPTRSRSLDRLSSDWPSSSPQRDDDRVAMADHLRHDFLHLCLKTNVKYLDPSKMFRDPVA